jgi:hypothetical protein
MTIYEIIWWVMFIILPILLVITTDDLFGLVVGTFMMGVIGAGIYMIVSGLTEWKVTSQFETTLIYLILDNDKLNIITDEYYHISYKDYESINKWKNGGKFYKVYSYKDCKFGPNENKYEVIIK